MPSGVYTRTAAHIAILSHNGKGNLGKKRLIKRRDYQAFYENARSRMQAESNPLWAGENVKYRALHSWVERHLGKSDTCKHCGKSGLIGRQIHWANKSHEYKCDFSDWIRLCVKCHRSYDKC